MDSNNSSSIIDTSIAVNADTEKMSTAVNADNGEKDNHREAPEILAGDGPDECILAQFDGISQALRNADHNNSSSIITATVDPDGCTLVGDTEPEQGGLKDVDFGDTDIKRSGLTSTRSRHIAIK